MSVCLYRFDVFGRQATTFTSSNWMEMFALSERVCVSEEFANMWFL